MPSNATEAVSTDAVVVTTRYDVFYVNCNTAYLTHGCGLQGWPSGMSELGDVDEPSAAIAVLQLLHSSLSSRFVVSRS